MLQLLSDIKVEKQECEGQLRLRYGELVCEYISRAESILQRVLLGTVTKFMGIQLV